MNNKVKALLASLRALERSVVENKGTVPSDWDNTVLCTIEKMMVEAYPDTYQDASTAIAMARFFDTDAHYVYRAIEDNNPKLFENRDVALTFAKHNYTSVYALSASWIIPFLSDVEFVRAVSPYQGSIMRRASGAAAEDGASWMLAVTKGHLSLAALPSDSFLLRDKRFVMEAMQANGAYELHAADKSLREDIEVVLEGLRVIRDQKGTNYAILKAYFADCVSRKIRNNRTAMMDCIGVLPESYSYAFESAKVEDGVDDEKSLLVSYADNGGEAFSYDEKLKYLPKDPEKEVQRVITMMKCCLSEKAADNLACNVSKAVADSEEFARVCIPLVQYGLARVSKRLADNDEIVALAIAKNPENLRYASERLRKKYNYKEED